MWDESYVFETAVQKHDFEDLALLGRICRKPLRFQALREFKRFDRHIGGFIVRPIQCVELELDPRQPISKLRGFRGERLLIDFMGESHIEQTVLLRHEQC